MYTKIFSSDDRAQCTRVTQTQAHTHTHAKTTHIYFLAEDIGGGTWCFGNFPSFLHIKLFERTHFLVNIPIQKHI